MDVKELVARERTQRTERNMNAASDDELLHLIGTGNEAAFRLLVERHVDHEYRRRPPYPAQLQ